VFSSLQGASAALVSDAIASRQPSSAASSPDDFARSSLSAPRLSRAATCERSGRLEPSAPPLQTAGLQRLSPLSSPCEAPGPTARARPRIPGFALQIPERNGSLGEYDGQMLTRRADPGALARTIGVLPSVSDTASTLRRSYGYLSRSLPPPQNRNDDGH
jgi:hypothetical protein